MSADASHGRFFASTLLGRAALSRAYERLRVRLKPAVARPPEIDEQVSLVSLPVVVSDWRGRFVRHLRAEHFAVFEDGKRQPVAGLRECGPPLSIGLILDNSESISHKRREIKEIAFSFVEATDPLDEIFVVNFNERPCLGLPGNASFSSNIKELEEAIQGAEPCGKTALFDAVLLALKRIELGGNEGKCLVVISDGCDEASSANLQNMLTQAERSSVLIHTVGMFDTGANGKRPKIFGTRGSHRRACTHSEYFPVTGGRGPEARTATSRILHRAVRLLESCGTQCFSKGSRCRPHFYFRSIPELDI